MLAPNWLILGTRGFVAHVPSYEKIDFLTGGTPVGGHKNFCGTRDMRQSIFRARVPKISQFGAKIKKLKKLIF